MMENKIVVVDKTTEYKNHQTIIEKPLKQEMLGFPPYESQYYSHRLQKWVPVEVNIVREIGSGNSMTAYEAVVVFKIDECEKRRRFVIKRPRGDFGDEDVLDETEHPYANQMRIRICSNVTKGYRIAKKTGLKVFPTCDYMLGAYGPEIIETLGFSDDWICVGDKEGPSAYAETFDREKLKSIDNIDSLLVDVFEQAILGCISGVYIDADAYLFLVHKIEDTVDFRVGDVGSFAMMQEKEYEGSEDVLVSNLKSVSRSLTEFIGKNVASPMSDVYIDKIKKFVEKLESEDLLKGRINTAKRVRNFLSKLF